MNAKEKVDYLIEQRILESAKKQITKKCLQILSTMGKPITEEAHLQTPYYEPWETEESLIYDPLNTNIRTIDPEEWRSLEIGKYFDGLYCGINLCIRAMNYESKLGELKVTYNGYLVYAEIEGQLCAYAPFPAWENALDMFYEGALVKEKKTLEQKKEEEQSIRRKKLNAFWNKFKKLWGY